MPYTCAICSLEIQTGEPMLSNDRMELAHKSCVDRLPVPPSPVISVVAKVGGPGFGNPTASVEPCLMPSRPSDLCAECGEKSISMCPYCRVYVHHGYGYGKSCSLLHEQKCSEAYRSREIGQKPPVQAIVIPMKGVSRNGVHAKPVRARKARR